MATGNGKSADEAAVRAVVDAIVKAVRAKDVEAMLAQCAPELVTFDMVPPIQHEGAEAIRRLWDKTLAGFVPPLDYDTHDVDVQVGGDVAFVRCLNQFGGTHTDGTRTNNWLRSTFGLRKIGGRWKAVHEHEHVSVPFDMETGKALPELKP